MAKKRRKGDLYAALSKTLGRPVKAGTKLKKQPKPRDIVGGTGKSGGSMGRGKSAGGSKMGKGKMGKTKLPSLGKSKTKAGKMGTKESPRRARPPQESAFEPDSKKTQQAVDNAYAGQGKSNPETEPKSQPVPERVSEPSRAPTQTAPTDIPNDPVGEIPRAQGGNDPFRPSARPQAPPRTPHAKNPDNRARRGSREAKQDLNEERAALPTREPPPMDTEAELAQVQQAITTPQAQDIEMLMSDPQKFISSFIDTFGEQNVPPEVWAMLEAPTGQPPSEYPYPAGAMPPNAPPPPMDDPFYPGPMPPQGMMPPAAMPPASMPMAPKGDRLDMFLPEDEAPQRPPGRFGIRY